MVLSFLKELWVEIDSVISEWISLSHLVSIYFESSHGLSFVVDEDIVSLDKVSSDRELNLDLALKGFSTSVESICKLVTHV